MDEKENKEIIKKDDTTEKKKKKTPGLLRVIIIIAAAALILLVLVRIYHSFFSSTGGRLIGSCINTIGYEQGDKADFYTTGDGLYFVTKDGVIYMNKKGTSMKWQDTYTMMNPVVSGEGDIIGVSEKGGSLFSVYNTSGNLYKITPESSISSFAVNEKGGSSLITENDTEYTITAYTESGFTAFMAKSPVEEGLAVSCDISDDGRYLAVSYIYTGYTELESRVIFYNLKQSGDSNIDEEKEMVASFVRSGEIMGIVRFMDGDNFIAVSSSEIVCIKLSVDGNSVRCSEKWSVQAQNSIKAITFPGKKYVSVAYGEKNLNSESAEEENTVVTYNLNGKEMFKTVMDKTIDGMFSDSSVIVVKMNRSFQALDKKGGRILAYTVAQDVNKLLVYDGNSKALIITPKGAYIMEIKSKGISTIISNIRNNDDEDSIGTETEDETEASEEEEIITEAVSDGESPAEDADTSAEASAETPEGGEDETAAEPEETEETEDETEEETQAEAAPEGEEGEDELSEE